jgi:hypothetical protein
MKHVRIEIFVTTYVHVGEDVGEALPPKSAPFISEEIVLKRVAPLNDSFQTASEAGNIYATVKANTVSILASVASVLPEKLAHAARKFAQ